MASYGGVFRRRPLKRLFDKRYRSYIASVISSVLVNTISDNFNDNSISAVWTATNSADPSQVFEQNQQVEITHNTSAQYNALQTVLTYSYTSVGAYVKLVNAGNQALTSHEAIFGAVVDASNLIWFNVSGNNLYAFKKVGGSQAQVGSSIAYNSSTHAYLRISESGGTWSWDTSPDGSSWTNRWTLANPFGTTLAKALLQTGAWQVEASGSFAYFDDFNVVGAVAHTATPADNVSVASAIAKSVTKTITSIVSAASAATKNTGKRVSDNATAASANSKNVGKALADNVSAASAASKSVAKLLADSTSVASVAARAVGKTLADSATVASAVSKAMGVTLSDGVEADDDDLEQLVKLILVEDSVGAASAVTSKAVGKGVNSPVSASSAITKAVAAILADNVTASSVLAKAMSKALVDNVSLTDAQIKTLGKNLAENMSVSSAQTKVVGINRSENVSVADTVAKSMGKYANDSVALQDAITTAANYFLLLQSAVTLTETQEKAISKAIDDGVSITDFVARTSGQQFTVEVHDVVSLIDEVTFLFNYLLLTWYALNNTDAFAEAAGEWFEPNPKTMAEQEQTSWYTKNNTEWE